MEPNQRYSVAAGLKSTFEQQLDKGFDGGFGDIGISLTYQAMLNLPEKFWTLLRRYRVFVVFDEIHHCAGDEAGFNAWGQVILRRIQQDAQYTLALTGTPWRSDHLRIAMARYSDPEGKIMLDYRYGLRQAISDQVCRIPHIVLIDNNKITIRRDEGSEQFVSLASALNSGEVQFRQMLFNEDTLRFTLNQAVRKLSALKIEQPTAGGLVVAASVAHANLLANILSNEFKQSYVVVNYNDPNSHKKISEFRTSTTSWIVSVGMVAEGTDIPRLRVCCLLSLARTELFFRQVLGRVLRKQSGSLNNSGWLYCLAEPSLIQFAERLEEEIPEQQVISRLNIDSEQSGAGSGVNNSAPNSRVSPRNITSSELLLEGQFQSQPMDTPGLPNEVLLSVWMQGTFTERVLALIG